MTQDSDMIDQVVNAPDANKMGKRWPAERSDAENVDDNTVDHDNINLDFDLR